MFSSSITADANLTIFTIFTNKFTNLLNTTSMQNTIFRVEELDSLSEPILVGYYTGNPIDIKRYFKDKNSYVGVTVKLIEFTYISTQMANERELLINEKKELETRLKEIEKII